MTRILSPKVFRFVLKFLFYLTYKKKILWIGSFYCDKYPDFVKTYNSYLINVICSYAFFSVLKKKEYKSIVDLVCKWVMSYVEETKHFTRVHVKSHKSQKGFKYTQERFYLSEWIFVSKESVLIYLALVIFN